MNIKEDATDIILEVCAFKDVAALLLLWIIYNADLLDQTLTHFNPLYEIALRNEALRCNTSWLFLDFSITSL